MAANPKVNLKKDYVMHLETTYRVSAPDHDHVKIEAVPKELADPNKKPKGILDQTLLFLVMNLDYAKWRAQLQLWRKDGALDPPTQNTASQHEHG